MCSLIAVAIGAKAFGTLLQGDAARKHGQAVFDEENRNATFSEQAAGEAVERGRLRDLQEAMKGTAVESAAMVQQSGSGADVNVGAPLATRLATRANVDVDRAIVQRNAAMEAYGLRTKARAERQSGENARQAGENAYVGSFLTALSGGIVDAAQIGTDQSSGGGSSGPSSDDLRQQGSVDL